MYKIKKKIFKICDRLEYFLRIANKFSFIIICKCFNFISKHKISIFKKSRWWCYTYKFKGKVIKTISLIFFIKTLKWDIWFKSFIEINKKLQKENLSFLPEINTKKYSVNYDFINDVISLEEYLDNNNNVEEAKKIIKKTVSTIKEFDNKDYYHWDLNLKNILISSNKNEIYLIDFESSREMKEKKGFYIKKDWDKFNKRLLKYPIIQENAIIS